jgi:peptidoglycan/LPS O-acetylase OafA/YrhL
MAGLALGSYEVRRVIARLREKERPTRPVGFGLVVGFVVLALGTSALVVIAERATLLTYALTLFATGYLVAGVFAYVSLADDRPQRGLVSPLYAADLFGGCLGSVVGGLILVPFFGLAASTVAVLLLALLALLLV